MFFLQQMALELSDCTLGEIVLRCYIHRRRVDALRRLLHLMLAQGC